MANNYNKKNKNKVISIAIIMCILFFVAILLNRNSNKVEEIREIDLPENELIEVEKNREIENLQNMKERDRMEYYFNKFLEFIEDEKYEEAYSLLYPEFKENYYPTLEQFIEIMNQTFSDMTNVEHDNIERNGDVYVLWIYITDAVNGKPGEKKEMNVVIKENDYNDFELSFSFK